MAVYEVYKNRILKDGTAVDSSLYLNEYRVDYLYADTEEFKAKYFVGSVECPDNNPYRVYPGSVSIDLGVAQGSVDDGLLWLVRNVQDGDTVRIVEPGEYYCPVTYSLNVVPCLDSVDLESGIAHMHWLQTDECGIAATGGTCEVSNDIPVKDVAFVNASGGDVKVILSAPTDCTRRPETCVTVYEPFLDALAHTTANAAVGSVVCDIVSSNCEKIRRYRGSFKFQFPFKRVDGVTFVSTDLSCDSYSSRPTDSHDFYLDLEYAGFGSFSTEIVNCSVAGPIGLPSSVKYVSDTVFRDCKSVIIDDPKSVVIRCIVLGSTYGSHIIRSDSVLDCVFYGCRCFPVHGFAINCAFIDIGNDCPVDTALASSYGNRGYAHLASWNTYIVNSYLLDVKPAATYWTQWDSIYEAGNLLSLFGCIVSDDLDAKYDVTVSGLPVIKPDGVIAPYQTQTKTVTFDKYKSTICCFSEKTPPGVYERIKSIRPGFEFVDFSNITPTLFSCGFFGLTETFYREKIEPTMGLELARTGDGYQREEFKLRGSLISPMRALFENREKHFTDIFKRPLSCMYSCIGPVFSEIPDRLSLVVSSVRTGFATISPHIQLVNRGSNVRVSVSGNKILNAYVNGTPVDFYGGNIVFSTDDAVSFVEVVGSRDVHVVLGAEDDKLKYYEFGSVDAAREYINCLWCDISTSGNNSATAYPVDAYSDGLIVYHIHGNGKFDWSETTRKAGPIEKCEIYPYLLPEVAIPAHVDVYDDCILSKFEYLYGLRSITFDGHGSAEIEQATQSGAVGYALTLMYRDVDYYRDDLPLYTFGEFTKKPMFFNFRIPTGASIAGDMFFVGCTSDSCDTSVFSRMYRAEETVGYGTETGRPMYKTYPEVYIAPTYVNCRFRYPLYGDVHGTFIACEFRDQPETEWARKPVGGTSKLASFRECMFDRCYAVHGKIRDSYLSHPHSQVVVGTEDEKGVRGKGSNWYDPYTRIQYVGCIFGKESGDNEKVGSMPRNSTNTGDVGQRGHLRHDFTYQDTVFDRLPPDTESGGQGTQYRGQFNVSDTGEDYLSSPDGEFSNLYYDTDYRNKQQRCFEMCLSALYTSMMLDGFASKKFSDIASKLSEYAMQCINTVFSETYGCVYTIQTVLKGTLGYTYFSCRVHTVLPYLYTSYFKNYIDKKYIPGNRTYDPYMSKSFYDWDSTAESKGFVPPFGTALKHLFTNSKAFLKQNGLCLPYNFSQAVFQSCASSTGKSFVEFKDSLVYSKDHGGLYFIDPFGPEVDMHVRFIDVLRSFLESAGVNADFKSHSASIDVDGKPHTAVWICDDTDLPPLL